MQDHIRRQKTIVIGFTEENVITQVLAEATNGRKYSAVDDVKYVHLPRASLSQGCVDKLKLGSIIYWRERVPYGHGTGTFRHIVRGEDVFLGVALRKQAGERVVEAHIGKDMCT